MKHRVYLHVVYKTLKFDIMTLHVSHYVFLLKFQIKQSQINTFQTLSILSVVYSHHFKNR